MAPNIYEIREAFMLPGQNNKYVLPSLQFRGGDCAIFHGQDRTRPGELVLSLAGTVPEDGYSERPTGNKIKQTVRQVMTKSFPLYLNGSAIYGNADTKRRLGLICSNPDLNIFGRTVLEDYLNALVSVGRNPQQQVAALDLDPYKLVSKLDRGTDLLSGGEKQRLNCATALSGSRDLLALDFSAMSLDPGFREFFLQLVNQFCANGGILLAAGVTPDDATQLSNITRHDYVLNATADGNVEVTVAPTGFHFPTIADEIVALRGLLKTRKTGGAILELQNVQRKNVTIATSFMLNQSELLVVSGENGIGKTTLGQILVHRLSEKQTGGRIIQLGEAHPVMATQFPDDMIICLSLREEMPDAALRALCGLDGISDNSDPRELPYGSRKLLGVANALRLSQGFAVLDEPTCGLDSSQKEQLIALFNHFPELAVIVFTHDPALLGLGLRNHEMRAN